MFAYRDEFKQQMRDAVRKAGSKESLAQVLGVSVTTLETYLRGKTTPRRDAYFRLGHFLDMEV